MNIIKLIKNSIKSIKITKKDTFFAVLSLFYSRFRDRLIKQYKFIGYFMRGLTIFRKWALFASIFSLVYGALGEIFTFKYDYRFLVSFGYGFFLVGIELVNEYSDHLFEYWYKLVSKISGKVAENATENNHIINQKSANQIKEVSEPHRYTPKIVHQTYNSDEYNYLTDWRVWVAGILITAGIITTIHLYGPELSSIKDSANSLYDKIKSYFFSRPDSGNNPPSNPNINSPDVSNKYLDEFKKDADAAVEKAFEGRK